MERFKRVVPALADFFNFSKQEIAEAKTKNIEPALSIRDEEFKSTPAVAVAHRSK